MTGSMCALMDDAIGWMGFCSSGQVKPWSGFTVQVNTALRKSVPIGSLMRLEASIEKREGSRKVWVRSRLVDGKCSTVYCEGYGLFLLNSK